jgi:hypothetical protein
MNGREAFAALPMYALQGMAPVNEALWAAIRATLDAEGIGDLPAHLSPSALALPAAIAPATLFSQMCGYPLLRLYAGQYRRIVPSSSSPAPPRRARSRICAAAASP